MTKKKALLLNGSVLILYALSFLIFNFKSITTDSYLNVKFYASFSPIVLIFSATFFLKQKILTVRISYLDLIIIFLFSINVVFQFQNNSALNLAYLSGLFTLYISLKIFFSELKLQLIILLCLE